MKTKSVKKSKIIISAMVLAAVNLLTWIEPHLPVLQQIVTDSGIAAALPPGTLNVLNMIMAGLIARFRLTSNTTIAPEPKTRSQ